MSKFFSLSFLTMMVLSFTSCNRKTSVQQHGEKDLVDYVDVFIGTAAHGHTFPGATLPFGMVQLSPDNGISGWDWCSGYNISEDTIVGFSHLHLSGTGIGDLADILVMPVNRKVDFTKRVKTRSDYQYRSSFRHENEKASPGYYKVYLDDNQVNAELTTSLRAGMHRYTFEQNKNNSLVLDLSFAINWDKPTDTYIKLDNDTLVTGYRFSKGWAPDQRVFFAMRLSQPVTSKILALDTVIVEDTDEIMGKNAKAQFFFDNASSDPLMVKAGISSASIEGALANLDHDIPDWDFDGVVQNARDTWKKELSKIQVKSYDENLKTIFYTALYHSCIAPNLFSDLDGSYKGADGQYHKATNFNYYSTFSLWDTFRANHPLFTITQPDKINDFIRTMLAHYDEYGYLPVWPLQANETNCMTGYHAVPVIVDAYFKGFRDYDVNKAFEAMKHSGMQDIRGVEYYKKYGYIPADLESQSVTKNLEYAYDDWCIAQMARDLGKEEDYNYFLKRANSYKILFDPVTGFMRGKLSNGQWKPNFDPAFSSHGADADYTEGNAWQHSFFVPQDVQGLIDLYGSAARFTTKLDSLFTESSIIKGANKSPDISGLIGQYAHGNEPSHHIAYLYDYAGKPWKSQYYIREIMDSLYTSKPDGLCGNEDCGQMSAWYVLSAIGFYPVNPADGNYVFGSPSFPEVTIQLPGDKSFHVVARSVSDKNKYIQKVSLNGKPLDRTYINYKEIMDGGELIFDMGESPNEQWGVSAKAVPPSMTPVQ